MLVVDNIAGLPSAKIGTGATPLLVSCTLPLTEIGFALPSCWANIVLAGHKNKNSNEKVTFFKMGQCLDLAFGAQV